MGTAKRERQKANRLQRQIEEERAERVGSMRRTATRVGLIAVLAVAGVVLIAWIGGAFSGDDDDTADTPVPTQPIDDAPVATSPPPPDIPKPDVDTPDVLPEDLVISTLVEGEGPEAAAGDTVEVYYVGVRSEDGTEFDTNYESGRTFPVTLGLGTVIQGWEQGLLGVQEGGRYQLDIPADLAYGDRGSGALIQPGDALTFVVDIVSVTQG